MFAKMGLSLICALLCASGIAGALAPLSDDTKVTSRTTEFSDGAKGELEKIVADHKGDMGLYCRNLSTGEVIAINADESFPTASTIKVAVLCTAMDLLAKGTGPYDSYYDTISYDASTSTGGAGFIRNYQDGTRIELKELIHLMITVSDNIATNMLCGWIGLEAVNGWLANHGFEKTRMFSTIGGSIVEDQAGREQWGLGRTSPYEMASLMALITTGKAGTTSTTDEMLRVLGNQYFDGSIPAGVPPTVYVGSKSGSVNRSRSDNAIVAGPTGTYVLSVYTKNNEDTRWDSKNEAEAAIRRISNLIWHQFNPDSKWAPAAGSEKF